MSNEEKLINSIKKMTPEEALDVATYMADELEKQNRETEMKIKDLEQQETMATDPTKIRKDSDARMRLGI